MIKTLIALAMASILLGCSSGGDDNDAADNTAPPAAPGTDSEPGTDAPGTDGTPPPPPTGGTPTADSKAGVWLGTFGNADEGVYVIDNANSIAGLAVAADGSATSVFGSLGDGDTFQGTLDNHAHPASDAASPGVFAPRGESVPPVDYALNIVNGQTIESTDGGGVSLVFAAPGSITPATPESVAGSWRGDHSFCGLENNCSVVSVNLTFNGTDMTGNTEILNLETQTVGDFSPAITGTVAQFGEVLTTSFTWNELTFAGVLYLNADGTLILNADDTSSDPDAQTLSSQLTRQ